MGDSDSGDISPPPGRAVPAYGDRGRGRGKQSKKRKVRGQERAQPITFQQFGADGQKVSEQPKWEGIKVSPEEEEEGEKEAPKQDGYPLPIRAAAHGQTDALHWGMTERGWELEKIGCESGRNCLHYAAERGHIDTCKMIVEETQLKYTNTSPKGVTPAHLAAANGHTDLLKWGIEENGWELGGLSDSNGWTCLHCAGDQMETFQFLIQRTDLKYDIPNHDGVTPAHIAASEGEVGLLEWGLGQGWELKEVRSKAGQTCLHNAAAEGHLEACRFLVEQMGLKATDEDAEGLTPPQLAEKGGHTELMEKMGWGLPPQAG